MDLMHIAVAIAGVFAGFGVNQLSLKLSTKLETIFGNVSKAKGNTTKWVGWFLAVAFYAFIAGGGAYVVLGKTKLDGLGSAKPFIGAFLGGFGIGGLVSEILFQMPDLKTIGTV